MANTTSAFIALLQVCFCYPKNMDEDDLRAVLAVVERLGKKD